MFKRYEKRKKPPYWTPKKTLSAQRLALSENFGLRRLVLGAVPSAEWVATSGLVVTILAGIRFERSAVPWLVGLYITAAYWFTASTSFANPAVAIPRSLTNTFSGIQPIDLPGFIVAELLGAVCAMALMSWLLREQAERPIR